VADDARDPQLPNVPTMAESGLPQLQATYWSGIVAPADRPLRARRERPCCGSAPKRGYEFSPLDVDCHATLPWGSCPCNEGGYHVLIARSAGASPGERNHIRTFHVLSGPP